MNKKTSSLLVGTKNKKKMSAVQKKFNATVKKLEREKRLLGSWKKTSLEYERIRAEEYLPVVTEVRGLQEGLVYRFDEFYSRKSFSRRQKEKMAYFITEVCEDLLIEDVENVGLKTLYAQYSGANYDALAEKNEALKKEMIRDILSNVLDIDIEDDEIDFDNLEEAAKKVKEKVKEQQAENNTGAKSNNEHEDKDVSASVKAVYRRLTASLHPDREQDPVERERKTELMQRVTTAYREKDLLQLLELQLEIEQIDQEHIDTLPQQTLAHYVTILERQLEEVSSEVERIVTIFRQMSNLDWYDKLTPKQALELFHNDIKEAEKDREELLTDLASLTSVKRFQHWLKEFMHPDEDQMFDQMFDEMMAGGFSFGHHPTSKKGTPPF